jgi:hypothetical protein
LTSAPANFKQATSHFILRLSSISRIDEQMVYTMH